MRQLNIYSHYKSTPLVKLDTFPSQLVLNSKFSFLIYVSHAFSRVNGVRIVLKHETSTLCQRHTFISINFKFGVGDYVREVTSPAKFGTDPIRGRAAMWGQHIRVL